MESIGSIESDNEPKEEIEKAGDSFEVVNARATVQKTIIDIELGLDAFGDERMRWIDNNSNKFGNFFDIHKHDTEFIRRCIENPEAIFEEFQSYKSELESSSEEQLAA